MGFSRTPSGTSIRVLEESSGPRRGRFRMRHSRVPTYFPTRRSFSMELGLDVQKADSHAVVDVKGEIDVYTAPKLREKLIELVSEGSYDVVVNLEGVDFLDSTGLGVLVGALKRVKAHDGSLSLVCTQDKILKIFKITGLTKVFPIHASVEEATGAAAS
jgi:anti-sigma B factor antagonist